MQGQLINLLQIGHNLRPTPRIVWSPFNDRIFYIGQTEISGTWVLGGWMLELDSLKSKWLFQVSGDS